MGDLNKRKGIVQGSEQEADDTVMTAHVPLASMFGYSTDLRSMTQVGSQICLSQKLCLSSHRFGLLLLTVGLPDNDQVVHASNPGTSSGMSLSPVGPRLRAESLFGCLRYCCEGTQHWRLKP